MSSSTYKPTYHITMSSSNLASQSPPFNKMVFQSTVSGYNLRGYEACLRSLTIPYSFPTFTSNSSFSYTWPAWGVNPATTYTVNIPSNTTWTVSDLNSLMQSVMVSNNQYLKDSAGNFVFYGSITANPPYYRVTYQAPLVPTSLPVGYTNPTSAFPFPTVASNVLINFADAQIQFVLGFNAGTYPPATTGAPYNVNGQNSPEVNPYSSIQVFSNLVSNIGSTFPNQLYSFPCLSQTTAYGGIIAVEPRQFEWVRCVDSVVNQVVVQLADQNGAPLIVLDPNFSLEVILKPIEGKSSGQLN